VPSGGERVTSGVVRITDIRVVLHERKHTASASFGYGLTGPFEVDANGDVHAPAGPGLGAGIDWDLINSAVLAVAA
jgi:hypothetical protein